MGNYHLPSREDLARLHNEVRNSQVRITTGKAGGSGTVIYSKPDKTGKFSTFVLTCNHVISDLIKHDKQWDPKLQKDMKKEYKEAANVEFFDYDNVLHGRKPVSSSTYGDVIAYDVEHDMALIKVRTVKVAPFVAKLLPKERIEEELTVGSPTVAVGAALLHDPIITSGEITHMGDESRFKLYWMANNSIIFGNSGGAMFYHAADGYYLIGIPSMVAVIGWGSPVTHLGYFSPITRIYEFLEEQVFDFIVPGSKKTEEQCDAERKKIREEAAKRGDEGASSVGALVDSRG